MKTIRLPNGDIVTLRLAVPDDAEEIINHINLVAGQSDFLTFGAGEFKSTIEEEKSFIKAVNGSGNGLFIVAEIQGAIAGCLTFRAGMNPRVAHTGEYAMTVDKKYWGQGIGREFTLYLIDWAKKHGKIRKINLKVRADHTRGIELYKRLGFVHEGLITREFYCNGTFFDASIMGLHIDPQNT